MKLTSRILCTRLDHAIPGLLIGIAVCLNSCSAISTLNDCSWICLPLAVLACVVLLLFPNAEGKKSALTVGALVFTLPIVMSAIVNLSYSNIVNSMTLLITILLAYLCVRKTKAEWLCRAFVSIMCVTSFFSLCLWILTNIAKIDLPVPVFENVNGVHYKTLGIVSQFVEPYIQHSNSMGFFWECGVFASYLLLAIVVEFLLSEKVSKLRLVLLTITLLTTGSTAGYLLLPLAISFGFLRRSGKAGVVVSVCLLAFTLIVLLNYSSIVDTLAGLNPSLFGKLADTDAVTRLTRLQSPGICWELFLQNPLFGLGYGDALGAYAAYTISSSTVDSLTTTSFFQLAAFGVAGFAIWFVTLFSVFGTHRASFSASLILTFLLVAILNKEPHTSSCLTYLLIFSFLSLQDQRIIIHNN